MNPRFNKFENLMASEASVLRENFFSPYIKANRAEKEGDMKRVALSLILVLVILTVGSVDRLSAQEMAIKTNLLYDATTTMNLGYEVALGQKTTLDLWVNYNPWSLGNKWVGIEGRPDLVEQRPSKLKSLTAQPELRWWLCEKFNGHFFGVHLHGGIFDVGALKLPFDWGRYEGAGGKYPVEMSTGKTNSDGDLLMVNGIQYPAGRDPNNVYSYADGDGIFVNSFEGWLIGAGVSYGYHWIITPRFSMEFTVGVGYAYLDFEKSRCTDCKQHLGDEKAHYLGPTRAGISLVYMLK